MKPLKVAFIITICLAPLMVLGQTEKIFNDINFGESLAIVKDKTSQICHEQIVISFDQPNFPLASNSEQHLVCSQLKVKDFLIKKAVFTFADNELVHIEVRGNAIKAFIETRDDEPITYLNYSVFYDDLLFGNTKDDIVWILTPQGARASLYAWVNPYFEKTNFHVYNESAEIPHFLKLGSEMEKLYPLFEEVSLFTKKEELDNSNPYADLQINCFGVEYAGFPRKIEARFGNGILNSVWILTSKAEEGRIRQKLRKAYGEQVMVTDEFEVFNDWKVLLRKDKPEVLLLNEALIPAYKEFLLQSE